MEEKKLELRLAPPGAEEEDNWNSCFHNSFSTLKTCSGSKRGLENMNATTQWSSSSLHNYHQPKSLISAMGKEVKLQETTEKLTFLPASAVNNTAVHNTPQKRSAPAPVVGWPPIRSFRKNLANSTCSRPKAETKEQTFAPVKKIASEKLVENCCKGLFVKINMDGVAIGRKVDLRAYDSYEKLSCSVDELFKGLLAAQRDPSDEESQNNDKADKLTTGLLDGRGEYTLVYEDNEGDRMLVGDVPWHMFVSTVKRLRVLKSSEISSLILDSSKQEKSHVDTAAVLK